MGKRFLLPLIAGCVVAAAVLLYRTGPTWLPRLEAGSGSPAVWSEDGGADLLVGWVLRAEDCLSCTTPTTAFRQMKAKYGDRVKIVGVGVATDSAAVESFLRRERLQVQMTYLDRLAYHRQFGWSPVPAVYVVRDGKVVVAPEAGARSPDRLAEIVMLEDTVHRMIARQ